MEFREGFNEKHYKAKSLYSFDFQNHKKLNRNKNLQDIFLDLGQNLISKTQSLRYAKTSKASRSSSQQYSKNKLYKKNFNIQVSDNFCSDSHQKINLRKGQGQTFSIMYSEINPQVIKRKKLYQNDCLLSTKIQNQKAQNTKQKQIKQKQKYSLIELLKKNSLKQNDKNNKLIQKVKQNQKVCQKYSSERKKFEFLIKKEKYLITQEKQQTNNVSQTNRNHIFSSRCHRNRLLKFDCNKDKICPWINYQETY